jgi:hypothetical protein
MGTELESLIEPLWTRLHMCAAKTESINRLVEKARRLEERGLKERAYQDEGEILALRQQMISDREQVINAANVVLRETGKHL